MASHLGFLARERADLPFAGLPRILACGSWVAVSGVCHSEHRGQLWRFPRGGRPTPAPCGRHVHDIHPDEGAVMFRGPAGKLHYGWLESDGAVKDLGTLQIANEARFGPAPDLLFGNATEGVGIRKIGGFGPGWWRVLTCEAVLALPATGTVYPSPSGRSLIVAERLPQSEIALQSCLVEPDEYAITAWWASEPLCRVDLERFRAASLGSGPTVTTFGMRDVVFDRAERHAAVVDFYGVTVWLADLETCEWRKLEPVPKECRAILGCALEGDHLILSVMSNELLLIDLTDRAPMRRIPVPAPAPRALAIAHDGLRLVGAHDLGSLDVWVLPDLLGG